MPRGGAVMWEWFFSFSSCCPRLPSSKTCCCRWTFATPIPARHARALDLLQQVGIADQAHKLPSALSGGQQQRAAIARALANDPPILVADEPTGNLDSQTASAIFSLFSTLAQVGKTVIVVTHEKEFSTWFEHTIAIADGELV